MAVMLSKRWLFLTSSIAMFAAGLVVGSHIQRVDAQGANRVFELRTYTTTPGNLERLFARFRNHTLALFAKHGMTNLFYWTPMPDQKACT